ncbi:MAG: hypothetical protein M0Z66_00325 [Thermaerobacter sp.]|nr:hypothetical protein [Thermaerobacter sp.]
MYDPSDLQPGDVLLMTSGGRGFLPNLLDALIMFSEGNPLVHAALCGDGELIDPVWRVTCHPLDFYAKNGWRLRPNCPESSRRAAVDWARARVGDPYGLTELLEDGVRFDLHFVARAWYRLHRKRYTCSGFVAEAYTQAGVVLTYAPLPSPSDLSYSPMLLGRRPWDAKERKVKPPSGLKARKMAPRGGFHDPRRATASEGSHSSTVPAANAQRRRPRAG